uniref:Glycosyltransferase 2-like domain-containing protein n=1 Tax=mine drainage metagenome TaxID=410659 RepID=E6Q6W6_9ZZZZ
MSQFCFVVLSYNGIEYIPELLESIARQTYDNIHTIIVDNGSTDGTTEYVRRRGDSGLMLIENGENFGCAAGYNIGARHAAADADFICFLNQDVVLCDDFAEIMVERLTQSPNCGALQPLVRFMSDPSLVENCGHTADLWFSCETLGHGSSEVPAISGNFMFTLTAPVVRKLLFQQLEGFDEDLFIYYEDTDLSFRILLANFSIGFEPRAIAYHHQAASAGKKTNAWHIFLYTRNRIRLLWKYADSCAGYARLVTFCGASLMLAAVLSVRRPAESLAMARAFAWHLLNHRSNIAAKRTLRRRASRSTNAVFRSIVSSQGGLLELLRRGTALFRHAP